MGRDWRGVVPGGAGVGCWWGVDVGWSEGDEVCAAVTTGEAFGNDL